MAENPYDKNILLQNGVILKNLRRQDEKVFSFLNIIDAIKIIPGIIKSVIVMYFNFPDVVFSKGGHRVSPSFSSRILGVPVIIHESDTVPGKSNLWRVILPREWRYLFRISQILFKRQGGSCRQSDQKRIFIRDILGAKVFQNGRKCTTILILGGSQGSQNINDNILDILPELIEKYQVLHQCGKIIMKVALVDEFNFRKINT